MNISQVDRPVHTLRGKPTGHIHWGEWRGGVWERREAAR
jgi:hypothetical protein